MKTVGRVKSFILMSLLLICGSSTYADDVGLHFPIPLDGKVGRPMLAAMLDASMVGCFYRIQPATSEVRFSIVRVRHELDDFGS